MLLTYTDIENRTNEPGIQRIKRIIRKMSQSIIADLYWDFMKNPFLHFTVILLRDTPQPLDGKP